MMNEAKKMIVEEKYNIEADLIYTFFKSTSILLKIVFYSLNSEESYFSATTIYQADNRRITATSLYKIFGVSHFLVSTQLMVTI